jgi:hypothetical protein
MAFLLLLLIGLSTWGAAELLNPLWAFIVFFASMFSLIWYAIGKSEGSATS